MNVGFFTDDSMASGLYCRTVGNILPLQSEYAADEFILQPAREGFFNGNTNMIDASGQYADRCATYNIGRGIELSDAGEIRNRKIDLALDRYGFLSYKANTSATDINGYRFLGIAQSSTTVRQSYAGR